MEGVNSGPSDISKFVKRQGTYFCPLNLVDIHEAIIELPLRSPAGSASQYPVTNPIKETEPYPADDWMAQAMTDPVYLSSKEEDLSSATSAKLTLMRDLFWPWLRACIIKKQEKAGMKGDPSRPLWSEHEFLGMLNWHRAFFHHEMKSKITSPLEKSDGMWRMMVLSSPWAKCAHFDDLLYEGREISSNTLGVAEALIFSEDPYARSMRQAFRPRRDPTIPGLEDTAIRRLLEVTRHADFCDDRESWYVYCKYWGPEPFKGTLEDLLVKRAEWVNGRRQERMTSEGDRHDCELFNKGHSLCKGVL
jgi:hypothetical protein